MPKLQETSSSLHYTYNIVATIVTTIVFCTKETHNYDST